MEASYQGSRSKRMLNLVPQVPVKVAFLLDWEVIEVNYVIGIMVRNGTEFYTNMRAFSG